MLSLRIICVVTSIEGLRLLITSFEFSESRFRFVTTSNNSLLAELHYLFSEFLSRIGSDRSELWKPRLFVLKDVLIFAFNFEANFEPNCFFNMARFGGTVFINGSSIRLAVLCNILY